MMRCKILDEECVYADGEWSVPTLPILEEMLNSTARMTRMDYSPAMGDPKKRTFRICCEVHQATDIVDDEPVQFSPDVKY